MRSILRPARYGESVELSLVPERILGPALEHDVERRLEEPVVGGGVATVGGVVELDGGGVVGTARNTHVEPSSGKLVRGGKVLRETDGVVAGQDAGALPHSQVLGDARQLQADQHRIGARDGIAAVPEVVLAQPAGREASLIQGRGGVGPFGEAACAPDGVRARGSTRCRRIASGDPGSGSGSGTANQRQRRLLTHPGNSKDDDSGAVMRCLDLDGSIDFASDVTDSGFILEDDGRSDARSR